MKIMGFNFTKINVEKFLDRVDDLKLTTNINIEDLKEIKTASFKIKEDIIVVKFTYAINYEPKFAKIEMAGNIILGVEQKLTKEVIKQWKDKKTPEEFRTVLFNAILRKTNLKALQLEEEMNLPLHMPMPSLKPQEKQK
ncbi:MAG: hypothetical protein KJ949_03540 [Nanoarchaeota archaeon]|nr:hypothetical protein [Nanoarchaeota archaeon]